MLTITLPSTAPLVATAATAAAVQTWEGYLAGKDTRAIVKHIAKGEKIRLRKISKTTLSAGNMSRFTQKIITEARTVFRMIETPPIGSEDVTMDKFCLLMRALNKPLTPNEVGVGEQPIIEQ